MSDEMKNCCPPETTAPKMEVHDASEGSKDIKPKLVSTAHKKLTQDEFQRKVAMAARMKAAADLEKEAFGGAAAAAAGRVLPLLSRAWGGVKSMAGGVKSMATSPLATTGVLPSVAGGAKTWSTLLPRMLVGEKGVGSYLMHPVGQALAGGTMAYNALPYAGGALQRLGGALGGTVGQQAAQNFGGAIGGGLLGAGVGGLAGALMPGQEEYEDENGNVRKRSRGMLSGALRGAGMGGIAGGLGGAAMDHFGKTSAAQAFGTKVARSTRP